MEEANLSIQSEGGAKRTRVRSELNCHFYFYFLGAYGTMQKVNVVTSCPVRNSTCQAFIERGLRLPSTGHGRYRKHSAQHDPLYQ